MRARTLLVVLTLAVGSSSCASLGYGPLRPIQNPALQSAEGKVAAYGLELITEARAFGPAYESLVESGAMTPTTGLRLVRVERALAQGTRSIYDALAMIASLRRLAGTAADIQAQWDKVGQGADEVLGAGEDAIAEASTHVGIRAVIRAINSKVANVFKAAGGALP
jgi:hypothetical protein